MLCLGYLVLELSVELILFFLIVSSVIRSFMVHHFWSKINKSFLDILNYFLTIIVKLLLIKVALYVLIFRHFGALLLVLIRRRLLVISLLRLLTISIHVLYIIFHVSHFSFISFLFLHLFYNVICQLFYLVLTLLVHRLFVEVSKGQVVASHFFYF